MALKNVTFWAMEGFYLIAPVLILTSLISIIFTGRSFLIDITAVGLGVIVLPWAFAESRAVYDKYTKED